MDSPGVSAIVPIKNGSDYIATSIPRILRNLRKYDELIVIDDSSSDDSYALVQEATNGDPRIKLFRNPGSGIVDALSYGLRHATFEIISRFDIDDVYAFNRLERQRDLLRDNVVAVFCDYNIVDSRQNILGTIYSPVLPFATKLSLSQSQRTPHPGVVFSKSASLKVGGYRKGEDGVEDLSLWLRMSLIGDLISVPEVLFSYRIHEGSVTYSRRTEIQAKKLWILSEHPFGEDVLKENRLHLGEAISYYKTLPNAYSRILLMVREILLVGSCRHRIMSLSLIMKYTFKLNPLLLLEAALEIWVGSRRRRKLRSI